MFLMNDFALSDAPVQCDVFISHCGDRKEADMQQDTLSRSEFGTSPLHPSLTPLLFLILYYPDFLVE